MRFCAFAGLLGLLACTIAPAVDVPLSWKDNANNEQGFYVWRAEGSSMAFAKLATEGVNAQSHVDRTAVAGATYAYRVTVFNGAGESPPSNTVVVNVPDVPGLPLPATELAGPVWAGELANISTRALATNTDTTAIAGVIVTGAPVRALIRVAGPTLGAPPFNVPGTAADPLLTVVRHNPDGTVTTLAGNDNWDAPAAGSSWTVAQYNEATIAVAPGLTFAPGSKDAGCVLTLAPGSYSVITRTAGPDGVVLAEIYRVP